MSVHAAASASPATQVTEIDEAYASFDFELDSLLSSKNTSENVRKALTIIKSLGKQIYNYTTKYGHLTYGVLMEKAHFAKHNANLKAYNYALSVLERHCSKVK